MNAKRLRAGKSVQKSQHFSSFIDFHFWRRKIARHKFNSLHQTMGDANKEKYFPNHEELTILIQGLQKYFSLKQRSNERKMVVEEVCPKLQAINPKHWDKSKTRLWFNNNKDQYLNKPLSSIDALNQAPRPSQPPIIVEPYKGFDMTRAPIDPAPEMTPAFNFPHPTVQDTKPYIPQPATLTYSGDTSAFSLSRMNSTAFGDAFDFDTMPMASAVAQTPTFQPLQPIPIKQTPLQQVPMKMDNSPRPTPLSSLPTQPIQRPTQPPFAPIDNNIPEKPKIPEMKSQIPSMPISEFKEPTPVQIPVVDSMIIDLQSLPPVVPVKSKELKKEPDVIKSGPHPSFQAQPQFQPRQQSKVKITIDNSHNEEEEEEDKLPTMIKVPDGWTPTTSELDTKKFEFYNMLREIYSCANRAATLPDKERLERQKALEELISEVIKTMHEKLEIEFIACFDRSEKHIGTSNSNSLKRQVSTTTSIYTTGKVQEDVQMVEVSKGVRYPSNLTTTRSTTAAVRSYYRGLVTPQYTSIEGLECAASDGTGLAYAYFDEATHRTIVRIGDQMANTGLFAPAKAIYIDRESDPTEIYIADAYHALSYPLDALLANGGDDHADICTGCFVFPRPLKGENEYEEVHLAVSTRQDGSKLIYAGVGSRVVLFDPRLKGGAANMYTEANKLVMGNHGYAESAVNWREARRLKETLCQRPGDRVVAVASLDGKVAVAWAGHHSVYIYDGMKEYAILIGHTAGVSMIAVTEHFLVTGAEDNTLRLFDRDKLKLRIHVDRACEPTLCVAEGTVDGRMMLFAGGFDRRVRCYDLERPAALCEIDTGDCFPSAIAFDGKQTVSCVLQAPSTAGKNMPQERATGQLLELKFALDEQEAGK